MSQPTAHRPPATLSLGLILTALLIIAGCAAPASGPVPTPATGPVGAATLERDDVDDWLDGLVPAALEREGLAGATVSVVADGQVLTQRGFGSAELATADRPARPVDPSLTTFRVGSISKMITATAVMQQVEQGTIDLDADIAGYLDVEVPRRFDEPITARHLLSHTAGFEDRLSGVIISGDVAPALRDVVAVDPPVQVYRPGTVPTYSNYGYALAGYLVERVTGVPFADYVRDEIFTPAGMPGATFAQPLPDDAAGQAAVGYASLDVAVPFEILGPAPAGSMSATAADMAAYLLAMLGTPPDGSEPILASESLAAMAAPALGPDQLGGLATGDQVGLGWWQGRQNGRLVLGHGGDTTVFHSQMIMVPEEGTGIFVSINGNGTSGDATSALRTALTEGFVDRYHPAAGGDGSGRTGTSAEHAAVAAGSYALSRRSHTTFAELASIAAPITVTDHGDGTITVPLVSTTGGRPLRLEEIRADNRTWVWREVGGDLVVAMDVVDGRVVAIGALPAHTLQPAPAWWALITPISAAVAAISALVLIAWPIGAVLRRRHGVGIRDWSRARKVLRTITHLALIMVWVSSAAWLTVISLLGTVGAPEPLIRVAQVLTLLPAVGVATGVAQVITTIRHRGGFWAVTANLLITAALGGYLWVAWMCHLLAIDISY